MPKSLKDTIDSWIAGLNPEARKHISAWDTLALQQHLEDVALQDNKTPGDVPWIIHQDGGHEKPSPDDVWYPPERNEAEEPAVEVKKLGSTQKLLLRSMSLRTVYKTSEAARIIDASPNTTSKCLSTLERRGFVKKVRHGYWRKVKSL